MDANGRRRPKCVHFSTELREYWVTIAKKDSDKLLEIATEVLGFESDGAAYRVLYPIQIFQEGSCLAE